MRRLIPSAIEPGTDGQVLTSVAGVATWVGSANSARRETFTVTAAGFPSLTLADTPDPATVDLWWGTLYQGAPDAALYTISGKTLTFVNDGTTGLKAGDVITVDYQIGAGAVVGSLYAYGHSYVLSDGTYVTAGQEYFTQLQSRKSVPSLYSRALSSSVALETAWMLNAGYNGCTPWTPATSDAVVLLDCTFNDTTEMNTSSDAVLARFKHGLETAVAIVSAQQRIAGPDPAITRVGGGWVTQGSAADKTFTANAYTATVGDYAEFTATGDEVWVLVVCNPPCPTVEVKVDGTVHSTVDLSLDPDKATTMHVSSGGTIGYAQRIIRITGMGAGSHTVRLTHAGGSGVFYLESVLVPATSRPRVFVLLDPMPSSAFGGYSIHQTYQATIRTAAQDVVANYPNAQTVSLSPLDSSSTYLYADGVHPNDAGATKIADILQPLL